MVSRSSPAGECAVVLARYTLARYTSALTRTTVPGRDVAGDVPTLPVATDVVAAASALACLCALRASLIALIQDQAAGAFARCGDRQRLVVFIRPASTRRRYQRYHVHARMSSLLDVAFELDVVEASAAARMCLMPMQYLVWGLTFHAAVAVRLPGARANTREQALVAYDFDRTPSQVKW